MFDFTTEQRQERLPYLESGLNALTVRAQFLRDQLAGQMQRGQAGFTDIPEVISTIEHLSTSREGAPDTSWRFDVLPAPTVNTGSRFDPADNPEYLEAAQGYVASLEAFVEWAEGAVAAERADLV